MQFLKDWYGAHKNLHHAHLIFGERISTLESLESFLQETLTFSVHGNPDYWKEDFSVFGIDDSRRIATIARRKSFSKEKTILVLSMDSITIEAQNSLLKLFEDPVGNVHFFVITHHDTFLVPTLLSRMLLVGGYEKNATDIHIEDATAFLKGPLKKRLQYIEPLCEEKDKGKVLSFLNSLEYVLYERFKTDHSSYQLALENLLKVRSYVMDRSASLKMLLEHVAHTIPFGSV